MDNGIIAFLIVLGMMCVVTLVGGILDYLKSKKWRFLSKYKPNESPYNSPNLRTIFRLRFNLSISSCLSILFVFIIGANVLQLTEVAACKNFWIKNKCL